MTKHYLINVETLCCAPSPDLPNRDILITCETLYNRYSLVITRSTLQNFLEDLKAELETQ